MNKVSIFSIGQVINKIQLIIFEVLGNVLMKYGVNEIIHYTIYTTGGVAWW